MTSKTQPPDVSMSRLCRWVMSYAFKRWPQLSAVLGAMLLKTGLDVLKPWPMVFLVDYVLQTKVMPPWISRFVESLPGAHSQTALIGWSVSATVLVFLLSWALGLATAYANIGFGQRLVYTLAADLFAKLQQLSLAFHNSKSVGDNIRRVTSDCSCISVILKDALLPVISSLVSLAAMFSILWGVDSTLTLLALAVVPYMILVFRFYAKPMMERSYAQQEVEAQIYDVVEQTFAAIPVVQAFGREPSNDQRFHRVNQETLAAILSTTKVQLQFKILMGLATAVGTAAILWLGAKHALAGDLSIGAILLFLSYLGSLYSPLESIMYTTSTIQGAAGSARRVLEVMESEPDVKNKPNAIPMPRLRGHVQFENVTFSYLPNQPVLREISFEARPGETIALVGATGAGKSTLVSLIPRFYDPQNGRVVIDGHDLRDVQFKTLRDQVALVLQEPFLFPLSIAENIAYAKPNASLADIEAAARAANAHEFIEKLPEGYQTVIGERGATLSVGQRQRLSIARALLKDAPILILDEPTSALDAHTESLLMEALERLTKNRTTFIIAHRLSTVRKANRIIVLKEGAIVETGSHDELLAQNSIYAGFSRGRVTL
ncbi:MAG: ABC transporter ATP-binding protein [Verrucomicrobiota bacterium]